MEGQYSGLHEDAAEDGGRRVQHGEEIAGEAGARVEEGGGQEQGADLRTINEEGMGVEWRGTRNHDAIDTMTVVVLDFRGVLRMAPFAGRHVGVVLRDGYLGAVKHERPVPGRGGVPLGTPNVVLVVHPREVSNKAQPARLRHVGAETLPMFPDAVVRFEDARVGLSHLHSQGIPCERL